MPRTATNTDVNRARGLRILYVLPYFRPAFGFGGPAVGTDILTSEVAAAGCPVTVWTSNVLDASGARLKAGREGTNPLTVQRYRYFSRALFRVTGALVTPGMFLDALDGTRKFDIVHLHDFRSVQAVCAFLYSRRSRTPLVLHPHGTLAIVLGRRVLKRMYDSMFGKRMLDKASRVVVLSDEEADEARHVEVSEAKIVVVPNGVRLPVDGERNLKGSFRRQHQISESSFLILFLGRIRVSKGVLVLLEAFSKFSQDYPESVLAVCGQDDGAETELRRAAGGLPGRVILPGLLTGRAKAEALIDSDAFCLPSAVETQSVAVLEAASYGLPVIAGKTSVPKDFVQEGAGVFVDLNSDALANALRRVANSPELRAACGARARALVERRYSIQSQLAAILELYAAVGDESHNGETRYV